jgi:phage repressor protein C with HTH and peptisase S24 domain
MAMATISMTDSNQRLRQAREGAGFSSARSAALRFGWTPSTYASHENGQTPVPAKEAPKYGKAFKVSAAWLLTGEGQRKSRNIVKVMGFIEDGAEIKDQVPPKGPTRVELPFSFPENIIAYQVRGNALWPRYEPGDVILCWDREREPGDLIGREVVAVAPGQRYLKRLGQGTRKGTFDLQSFNAEPIRGVRVSSVHEVLAVVRARQARPAP